MYQTAKIMKKWEYSTKNMWEISLDKDAPRLSIAIPEISIVKGMVYEAAEIMDLIEADHVIKKQDIETDTNYYLFQKNFLRVENENDLKHLKTEVDLAIDTIEYCKEKDLEGQMDFWRIIFEVNKEISLSIGETKIKKEINPFGAHIRLQDYPNKGIFRIKARDINQLRGLFHESIELVLEYI